MDNFFLFIDTETTGHDPMRNVDGTLVIPYHEIIDMGAVLSTCNFEILGTFEQKARPMHPERSLSSLINNYHERAKRGEWDNAITLQHAIGRLLKFSNSVNGQKTICCQNISFDWSFLVIAFALCGITPDDLMSFHNIHYAKLDSRSAAVQEVWQPDTLFHPNDYSIRKATLSRTLDIEDENWPHAALNGAMKCYEVFRKLREMRNQRQVIQRKE